MDKLQATIFAANRPPAPLASQSIYKVSEGATPLPAMIPVVPYEPVLGGVQFAVAKYPSLASPAWYGMIISQGIPPNPLKKVSRPFLQINI